MALPSLSLHLENELLGLANKGYLAYQYNPFYNLHDPNNAVNNISLKGLCLPIAKAELSIDQPLQIGAEICYDDSVNLIITDQVHPPKIINSRFYLTNSSEYTIADRKGNLDTNIYSEDSFKIETLLVKSTRTIISTDFLGLSDGGQMPIGNYTFYFKLADSDGNQSDFIAESGKVVCHVGTINKPSAIRGGQLNENSNKVINFRLNNLDLAYDYIDIYYTRSTGDGASEITKTYKINTKFKITNNNTEFAITGYEEHQEVSIDDINIQYENFAAVKTLANCQNISFAGNTLNDYDKFSLLEKLSLHITPTIVFDEQGIGNLDHNYIEQYNDIGWEYYNVNNIYYKLGYWDEEIYRFGVVYIMNDYTLSPVFNIRGKKTIDLETQYKNFLISDEINYREDYIIIGTDDENVKGVVKIDASVNNMFNEDDSIKPIGIKFNINPNVLEQSGGYLGLKDLTKGFFIVRQKRIPTILTQSVAIGSSVNSHIPIIKTYLVTDGETDSTGSWTAEAFLKDRDSSEIYIIPKLASTLFKIPLVYNAKTTTLQNTLLCPEASVKLNLFNSFFNSSEFVLRPFKYTSGLKIFNSYADNLNHFVLPQLVNYSESKESFTSELLLIEPGIEKINLGKYSFCSKAGDASIAYKHVDPLLGDFEDPETGMNWVQPGTTSKGNLWNKTTTKVRGEFNTFIGTNCEKLEHGQHYNIFQQGYNFDAGWKNYFLVRYNDASSFFPITDRYSWDSLPLDIIAFRGDCYINTYTHRMNWNFIDPDLPTNHKVVDSYTWGKNFRISNKDDIIVQTDILPSESEFTTTLKYKKLLPLFTYASSKIAGFSGEEITADKLGILEPTDKKYKKYSDLNGTFGSDKINRPDVNAVDLGHWVTFKVCSNINLAMRDLDYTRPEEEALHRQKRGFFPLQAINKASNLPESNVINGGISKSLGDKYYYEIPDVPFLRTNFTNRIYHSYPLQQSSFTNNNRIFEKKNYQDYTNEYGALVKLVEWYGTLVAIMEHGLLMIPVNERALMTNASGQNVYVNTDTVLPLNPKVLSNTFGSLWEDSITKTSKFIYGIDTVAKKIWRTDGNKFEIISDLKVQKFLNDNIKLRESDKDKLVNTNFIKTYYNAFKQDLLFVFVYGTTSWNLCWNELLDKWVTRYTWFPEFSENINNIFYTFGNNKNHSLAKNKLYKHGFAGVEDIAGLIEPTKWYGEQQPFEFEFIVNTPQGVQKIFDNLKIISNNVEPNSLIYEIVGDGYDWSQYKSKILELNATKVSQEDLLKIGMGFGYPFPWLL